jgi:FG-GAP repeat
MSTAGRPLLAGFCLLALFLPLGDADALEPPPGVVRLISSRTLETIYTASAGEPGDAFGAFTGGGDFFSRTSERDLVVGAPAARPAADGGAPHGTVWAVDPKTGELLAAIDGDRLSGAPVRHLGQSVGVLGHPTHSPQAWWALGAPGEPGSHEKGVVIVLGDESLSELYRIRGSRDALFGWRTLTLGSDVDGDSPAALEFVVTAPLEGRKGKRAEAGSVSLYSVLTGRRVWKVRGPHRKARFGFSASPADDLDGDGIRDLWVGAPGSPAAGVPGAVYLLSGRDGSTLRTEAAPEGAELFGFELQVVRDADGDGVADLLISAPATARGRRAEAGSAYLLSVASRGWLAEWQGRSAGQRLGSALAGFVNVTDDRQWVLVGSLVGGGALPARGRVDLYSPADHRVGSLSGQSAGERLGASVSGLNDVDGDRQTDLLIAAPGAPPIYSPD